MFTYIAGQRLLSRAHISSTAARMSRASTSVCAILAALSLSSAGAHAQMAPPPPQRAAMDGHASADAAQRTVNFITSVNRDEIAAGKLAMTKASSADVRDYARRMVDDHTNAMSAWKEKVPSLSLTIPDSSAIATKSPKAASNTAAMANGMSEVRDTTSRLRGGTVASAIHSANLAMMDSLATVSGASFDKLYLTSQIKGHEAVLKELAAQPQAMDDMQTLLTLFRTTVEKHLSDARKLQPN